MRVDQAKRLKDLEKENARLKKLEVMLANATGLDPREEGPIGQMPPTEETLDKSRKSA